MKSALIHLALALITCALVFTGYGMWYANVSARSAALIEVQNQIDARHEAASRLATTRAALVEIADDETVVQSYFVSETGVVAFIDALEARGHSLGATIDVLSVSTEDVSAQPMLMLDLSVKGKFDAVMRTVGAIEYAPYAISISAFSAGQDKNDDWHANLKIYVGSVSARTITNTP